MFKFFAGLRGNLSVIRTRVLTFVIMLMVFVLPAASVFAQEEPPTLDLSSLVTTLFNYIQLFIPLAIEVMGLPIAIAIAFAIISAVGYMLLKAFQNLRSGQM